MSKNKKSSNKHRPSGKNAFTQSVLNVFINSPSRGYNYKEVSARLGVKDKAGKDMVNVILIELI